MGMYTGLRGKITLNEEYAPKIKQAMEADIADFWDTVLPEGHPFLREGRRNQIPFGAVCYMPEDWGDGYAELDGNQWAICCSLKNYEGEIAIFINLVLPLIAERWDLESLYEEDDYPDVHIGSAD